jgi:hypothetical protein
LAKSAYFQEEFNVTCPSAAALEEAALVSGSFGTSVVTKSEEI